LLVFKFFFGGFWVLYGGQSASVYCWHSDMSTAPFNYAIIECVFVSLGAGVRFCPARRFLNWIPTIYKRRTARRVEILAKDKGKLHDVL